MLISVITPIKNNNLFTINPKDEKNIQKIHQIESTLINVSNFVIYECLENLIKINNKLFYNHEIKSKAFKEELLNIMKENNLVTNTIRDPNYKISKKKYSLSQKILLVSTFSFIDALEIIKTDNIKENNL
jgi:hypothetical protein